ncbi:immunoglobulin domain-containing protein [Pedobacter nutrimenti]|uniref:Ig-like domain-containing protein n=1 Tax=Pedobacter nutrimenti TaxID=1241337 RepID=A0A318U620_9SPHI|nr:immunoglobulin domain-containing protein [Pedobacter nutrimenti]PYF68433.1 Ig-like domain-containing protein [Pedobacter nutrimenti]
MKNLRNTISAMILLLALGNKATAQTSPDANTTVICSGTSKTLTSSVDGSSYQWYKDGQLISAAKSKTYDAATPGDYVVVAINEHGCASDASPAVKVLGVPDATPTITALNNNSCFTSGNNVELTGSGIPTTSINGLSYRYEWRKTGSNTVISNASKITLNTVSQSGSYTLTIVPVWSGADLTCSKTSAETTVTINPFAAKPTIATNIGNYASDDEKKAGVVCERNDVTLTASVASSDPNLTTTVTYQWLKDGAPISGQTTNVLKLTNVSSANSGLYTVTATTTTGCTATSDAVTIDVKARPAKPSIQY